MESVFQVIGPTPTRRPTFQLLLAIALFSAPLLGAESPRPGKPAKLEVSGYGFLGNRELRRALKLLQPDAGHPPHRYDASFVEDAALIVLSRLTKDGHLHPQVSARVVLDDGTTHTFQWSTNIGTPLPRPLAVARLKLTVQPGVLYYYEQVQFQGLNALKRERARAFFVETDTLIPLKRTRLYTPSRLDRSMANLREALNREGYVEASVTATNLARNDHTGETRVTIVVDEGLRSFARSVAVETHRPPATAPETRFMTNLHAAYSKYWIQNLAQGFRTNEYRQGYPDATVEIQPLSREQAGTNIAVDLKADVNTGPRIELSSVRFEGNERTRRSILKRRADLKPGGWLDRMAVERARFRISRLGVFDSVGVRYEAADDDSRDVVFELDEGKVIDFSVLFGYGSYEMLRGGFELSQYNVFGRAHESRLRAIQSFRATSADYFYTLPELFREDVSIFFTASGLRREEVSFVRQEYGGGLGSQYYYPSLKSDVSLRYNYEFLEAREPDADLPGSTDRAVVSAVLLDVKHDQRDNPLLPRKGYKVFHTIEFASASLGGQVDYQRFELATSYHLKLGLGHYLHLGLAHGAITTFGGTREDLPFNKRFFPGGESSIRGYQQGEASPLDDEGDVVGAETYLQANLEFEQVLTRAWSLVAFVDGVGFARDIANYPSDETLFSVGGGLRWRTLIGPARLEYGHNLNRRRHDPSGTLHFSLGFPF